MTTTEQGRRLAPDARRQQILHAARTTLATTGVTGFSLDQVAREAGVAVSLPRHYFGSREGLLQARFLIADGAIAALGFKTAATLLKSLELQTWNAILAFAAILALRTLVKRVLVWEERRLRAGAPHSAV